MRRRDALSEIGVGLASATLPSRGEDVVKVSAAASALYRRALVFDANLFPPMDDKLPQPPKTLEMARSSGVTAVKTSLGGFDNGFADTVAELAFYERVIEEHPDLNFTEALRRIWET